MRFTFRPPAEHAGLVTASEGIRLRVQTRVAETGRERHRLFVLTGLEVTENRARRLLNDVVSYRGYLEQAGTDVGTTTTAARAYIARILPQITSTLTVLPDSEG